MTFSQYAGTAIIPTLSRIILCAAFLPQGWIKCFTDARFDPAQAQALHALNVKTSPWIEPAPNPAATAPDAGQPSQAADAAQSETPADANQSSNGSTESPAGTSAKTAGPHVEAFAAPAMHRVTLLLESQGWPYPNWLALAVAATELVGGALLLIGFLARVWGMGLAIVMGVAFYLVTVQANQVFLSDPLVVAADPAKYQTMFLQLGLFLMAFGVCLTGAGPLSLDRWLFADEPDLTAAAHDLAPPDDVLEDDDSVDLDPPPSRPL